MLCIPASRRKAATSSTPVVTKRATHEKAHEAARQAKALGPGNKMKVEIVTLRQLAACFLTAPS
jgi:hypothetical protein